MGNPRATEVLVVGSGPAGVSTAFTLGKLGISTILIDKKPMEEIGNKVCGDALSPDYYNEANREIGLPVPDFETGDLKEIVKETVLLGTNQTSKIVIEDGSATVDRLKYGQKLIKSLEQFPHVEVISEMRLVNTIIENNFLVGVICRTPENEKIEFRTSIVIDASGEGGIVRRLLPSEFVGNRFPQRIPRHQLIVAYREIIRVKEKHPYQKGMYLVYEPEIAHVMPGYYWYFSRGPHEINIGLGYMMYDRNRGNNIKEINRKVRERRFPNAEVLESQGDLIPARLPLPSCVLNGFMTVGDAAALANPLNGEGHGVALIAGIIAGRHATKAIQNSDVSEKALWEYNRDIWKKYGVINSWGIAFIKFMNKCGFKTFDWLIDRKILQEDDITRMTSDPHLKLNLLSRAIRGWYKPRILLNLRKTMNYAREIQNLALNYPEIDEFDKWLKEMNRLEEYEI
ncbi:MAG: NAD(P)/FAD-dependent oxidoreductase [Candidatus Heimdallarchaeota archaeon]